MQQSTFLHNAAANILAGANSLLSHGHQHAHGR
jgi:hypothetical protein